MGRFKKFTVIFVNESLRCGKVPFSLKRLCIVSVRKVPGDLMPINLLAVEDKALEPIVYSKKNNILCRN